MIRKFLEMLVTPPSKDSILESKPIDQNIIQDKNVIFISRRIRMSYIVSEYERSKKK